MKYEFVSEENLKKFLSNLNKDFNKKISSLKTAGGIKVAVGDTQPVNASLWFNTSDFISEQGTTKTFYAGENNGGNFELIISDTKPDKVNCFWLNTSN